MLKLEGAGDVLLKSNNGLARAECPFVLVLHLWLDDRGTPDIHWPYWWL